MTSRRARAAATLLSCIVHALLLWRTADVEIARPQDFTPPVRVVLRQPAPPPAQRRPPAPPPPRPQAPAPPPVAAREPPPAPPEPAPEPPREAPPERQMPLPEQQIVAVPDGGSEEPPPDTRLRSDRDNKVDKEMVRAGEPEASREDAAAKPERRDDGGDGEPGDAPVAPAPPRPAAAAKAPLPGLAELLPGALALAAQQRDVPLPEPTPAPRAGGGGARSVKRAEDWQPQTTLRGSLDYLPDVQPGHLTLLNTKADLFAPFVRRVMTRVFQNMLILLRRSASTIQAGGRERVQAEAIMDRSGAMIGITIQERSTTMAIGLDRMLITACEAAFFDRNPPPGAESADGNIHFVLETVIQAVPAPGGRGVEISGLFGVGLL